MAEQLLAKIRNLNKNESSSPGSESSINSGGTSSVVSAEKDNGNVVLTNGRRPKTTEKNVPYTRGGDSGTAQLGTGERRRKDDCNFEALGTVDELCSVVGVAHAHLLENCEYGQLNEQLLDVMSRLFDVGSHVAKPRRQRKEEEEDEDKVATFTPNGVGGGMDPLHIDQLEEWINEMTEELPELTSFVLPTGAKSAAHLHVARTVCRRAERCMVPLVAAETCDPNAMRYMNRLSDYFFTAARWVNFCEGREEIQYQRQQNKDKQRQRVSRPLQQQPPPPQPQESSKSNGQTT
jgi:cob(I)alamin adenosyltransferase